MNDVHIQSQVSPFVFVILLISSSLNNTLYLEDVEILLDPFVFRFSVSLCWFLPSDDQGFVTQPPVQPRCPFRLFDRG